MIWTYAINQRIAVAFPYYGSRMMTAELRRRHGRVNRKRVQRLMRADNLLCLRRLKAWRKYPAHGYPVYPNLAAEFQTYSIDQLWVADLTYIRLHWGSAIWRSSWTYSAVAVWAGL